MLFSFRDPLTSPELDVLMSWGIKELLYYPSHRLSTGSSECAHILISPIKRLTKCPSRPLSSIQPPPEIEWNSNLYGPLAPNTDMSLVMANKRG